MLIDGLPPRDAYKAKFHTYRAGRWRMQDARQKVQRMERINACGNGLRRLLDVTLYVVPYAGPCALVLAFMVLAALAADGTYTAPAIHVFAPLFALVGVIVGSLCIGCWMRLCCHQRDNEPDSVCWHQLTANGESLPGLADQLIGEHLPAGSDCGNAVRVLYAACVCTAAALVPIVVALKVSAVAPFADASWGLELIPLWVTLAGWACLPCSARQFLRDNSSRGVYAMVTSVSTASGAGGAYRSSAQPQALTV
jgi:hypothetical protein